MKLVTHNITEGGFTGDIITPKVRVECRFFISQYMRFGALRLRRDLSS